MSFTVMPFNAMFFGGSGSSNSKPFGFVSVCTKYQKAFSSLNNLDPGDVESMRIAISSMAVGMSTALLTTLAGLTATLMLRVQLVMTDAPTETGAISDNDK